MFFSPALDEIDNVFAHAWHSKAGAALSVCGEGVK
jgi:hypothetical protein